MDLKCPKCGSTNVKLEEFAFICYGCGKEWQINVSPQFSELINSDNVLSDEEERQFVNYMVGYVLYKYKNQTPKTDEPQRRTYGAHRAQTTTEEKKQAAEKAQKEEQARANYQMWKERGDCTNCGGSPSKTKERVGSTAFFVDYYCGTCGKFVRTETLYSYV